jgi:hypothetical protein
VRRGLCCPHRARRLRADGLQGAQAARAQRKTLRAAEQGGRTSEERTAYRHELAAAELIFIAESGITTRMTRTYARAPLLPRYSPDFSPIEPCWSKIKALRRAKQVRSLEALDRELPAVLKAISAQNARRLVPSRRLSRSKLIGIRSSLRSWQA